MNPKITSHDQVYSSWSVRNKVRKKVKVRDKEYSSLQTSGFIVAFQKVFLPTSF